MYFKLREERNPTKVVEPLYIFLLTSEKLEKYFEMIQLNSSDNYVYRYNVEIFNLFEPGLQLVKTKTMIIIKVKDFLSELKKFEVQIILVLEYTKRNDCKIFHSSTKLIASDSDMNHLNVCIERLSQI